MLFYSSQLGLHHFVLGVSLIINWLDLIGCTTLDISRRAVADDHQLILAEVDSNEIITSSVNLSAKESRRKTPNLVFASFAGLLQQWPNTFASSGHSLIAGVIPRSTLLYHGLNDDDPPPMSLEWLAFDPEMSYAVPSRFGKGAVGLLIYITKRPLRIIYLDGQSAAKGPGYMDSQSVLINLTVAQHIPDKREQITEDYRRARDLCEMGDRIGFEGVVRMSSGFELIWCDFKKGIQLIDRINATDPFAPPMSSQPEKMNKKIQAEIDDSSESMSPPFYSVGPWQFVQSGTQHYHAPGEVRVILDPNTFISFYDGIDSLFEKRVREGTDHSPRSKHTLSGISKTDSKKIINRLKNVIKRKNSEGWKVKNQAEEEEEGGGEGLNLNSIVLTIIKRYNRRLEELLFTLKSNTTNPIQIALNTRWMTYGMLLPYINFNNFSSKNLNWIEPSIRKCSIAFTNDYHYQQQKEGEAKFDKNDSLHDSSKLIIDSIEGTLSKLCNVLIKVFSDTILLELPNKPILNVMNNDLSKIDEINKKIQIWKSDLDDLINWLGWSQTNHCDPICAPDQICFTPMWAGELINIPPDSNMTFPICLSHPIP